MQTLHEYIDGTAWVVYATPMRHIDIITTSVQRIHLYILALLGLTALGTLVYQNVEGWDFIDAFYFSVVTLATVGYGDHVPVTAAGKLFTTAYIMVGVIVFLLFTYELSRYIHDEK